MADSLASSMINTYTTFSGIDITAIFDNLVLATLSGIATSLTREKVPVFTFGSANARSISRGKRACAGSMQFTLFDRDAFYSLFLDESHFYYAHANEIAYLTNPINASEFTGLFFETADTSNAFSDFQQEAGIENPTGLNPPAGTSLAGREITFNTADAATSGQVIQGQAGANIPAGRAAGALSVKKAAQHADQVYPFDITLVAQNEYGRAASCAVIGVEVINEGGGISVDDITNEQQMTYIAITKLPWTPLTQEGPAESLIGRVTSLTGAQQVGDASTVTLGKYGSSFRGVQEPAAP